MERQGREGKKGAREGERGGIIPSPQIPGSATDAHQSPRKKSMPFRHVLGRALPRLSAGQSQGRVVQIAVLFGTAETIILIDEYARAPLGTLHPPACPASVRNYAYQLTCRS